MFSTAKLTERKKKTSVKGKEVVEEVETETVYKKAPAPAYYDKDLDFCVR